MEILILVLLCIIGALITYIIMDRRKRFFIEEIIEAQMKDANITEADVSIEITVRPSDVH